MGQHLIIVKNLLQDWNSEGIYITNKQMYLDFQNGLLKGETFKIYEDVLNEFMYSSS